MTDIPAKQSSFNAGEVSPKVYGRTDIERYSSAVKRMENMIPLVSGAATRRPGTEYIATVKSSDEDSLLVPFTFSLTQAYMLEFGDQYVRFFKDGGAILGGELITNGDMELNSDWTNTTSPPSTNKQSTDQRHNGDYSRKFVSTGADEGIQSATFSMTQGITYTVEAYVYSTEGTIKIDVLDGDGSTLDTQSHTITASTWSLVTFEVTSLATGSSARIIFMDPDAGASTYYIDDVSIKPDGGASGTGVIYELASPYTEDQLDELDFAQSADTLYIAHPDVTQRTLTRTDHDEWAFTEIEWVDGPYEVENTDTDHKLSISAKDPVGASINITSEDAAAVAKDLWRDTDVGRLVSIKHSTTWGVARITAITSSSVAVATIIRAFGSTTAELNWKLGIWCEENGYPRAVTFSLDRLIWAGSPAYPQHIWLSKVGLYTDHGAAVASDGTEASLVDSDGFTEVLGAKKVNAILWLEGLRKLEAGTVGAEWWLSSATGEGAITAISKRAILGSSHGSNTTKPVIVGHITLFLQRYGKVLHELKYAFEEDTFIGDELTQLAEHVTELYGITEMAYQNSPFRTIWCRRSDGELLGCTYQKSQKVIAWHRHPVANGELKRIAVMPGTTDDELWMIVRRKINGSYVKMIERLHNEFLAEDSTEAFFVDSGLTMDNRQDVTGLTTANPAVVTCVGHGYSGGGYDTGNGEVIMFRDVEGIEDANGDSVVNYFLYTVGTVLDTDTFELEYYDIADSEEKLNNGDFSDGDAYWTVGANCSISGGQATVSYVSGGDADTIKQSNQGVLEGGEEYIVSFDIISITPTTGQFMVRLGGPPASGTTRTTIGHYEERITAAQYDTFTLRAVAGTTVVDNVSVRKVKVDFSSGVTDYEQNGTVAKFATTLSNLDHLEGEDVEILADGAPLAAETVSSGSITLPSPGATVAHAGLPFVSNLETLNPEISQSSETTIQSRAKRITSVILRLVKSLGVEIGPDEDHLVPYPFVSDSVPMMRPADLFTGDTNPESIKSSWANEQHVYIRQDQPLPLTVAAILFDLEIEEGN